MFDVCVSSERRGLVRERLVMWIQLLAVVSKSFFFKIRFFLFIARKHIRR
jgi:hypothetical protein